MTWVRPVLGRIELGEKSHATGEKRRSHKLRKADPAPAIDDETTNRGPGFGDELVFAPLLETAGSHDVRIFTL